MKRYSLTSLVCLFALTACGGGGSDSASSSTNPPPPPPASEKPSGVWTGTLNEQGSGVTNDAHCLVTEAGEVACILTDPSTGQLVAGVHGSVSVSNGNQVSGSGTVIASPGFTLSNGSTFASFTITSGTVDERSSIDVVTSGAGDTAVINLAFDSIYDRAATMGAVAGVYTDFTVNGEPTSFSIDQNGEIFAQSASGCVGTGQISVGDPQVNHYDIQVTVSNCPGLNGTYSGLAISSDFIATDDWLIFAVFSGQAAIYGSVTE